ncbi:hypothetical protein Avbf_00731 [Armadillidium vulgare]|nr:hypothetical protein Avbf_00731 [Armadillidium vulgare]
MFLFLCFKPKQQILDRLSEINKAPSSGIGRKDKKIIKRTDNKSEKPWRNELKVKRNSKQKLRKTFAYLDD